MARFYSPDKREYLDITQPFEAEDKQPDILCSISRGHKKLTELDQWERLAKHQLDKRIIGYDKYCLTMDTIESLRNKAADTLDREMGVYRSPAQIKREQKAKDKELQANLKRELALLAAKKASNKINIKKALVVGSMVGALILMFNSLLLGGLLLGVLINTYRGMK